MEDEVITPDFDIGITPSHPPIAVQSRLDWAGLATGGGGLEWALWA